MTRLGLGSYAVSWAIGIPGYEQPPQPLDAFGLVRLAQTHGLRLVQIADNLPLHTLDATQRQQLRALADGAGIAIEVGTRGIAPEHLRQYMGLALEFQSPILRVVVDTAMHHPKPEDIIDMLRPQLAVLDALGVTLAIENHDRFKAQTLADIITALDHPRVGICLDTVNSFGALEPPEIVVSVLGRFIVNLHVKEFIVRRMRHNLGFEITGAPTGQGMLDVPWLLQRLNAEGRTYNAIIEAWLSPEATQAETLALESAWLRESVDYLRGLITD